MESAIVASDKWSTTLGVRRNTKLENNYLCRCQDYSMIEGLFHNTRNAKGEALAPSPSSEPVRASGKVYPNLRLNNNQSLCFPSLLYWPQSSIMVRFL